MCRANVCPCCSVHAQKPRKRRTKCSKEKTCGGRRNCKKRSVDEYVKENGNDDDKRSNHTVLGAEESECSLSNFGRNALHLLRPCITRENYARANSSNNERCNSSYNSEEKCALELDP